MSLLRVLKGSQWGLLVPTGSYLGLMGLTLVLRDPKGCFDLMKKITFCSFYEFIRIYNFFPMLTSTTSNTNTFVTKFLQNLDKNFWRQDFMDDYFSVLVCHDDFNIVCILPQNVLFTKHWKSLYATRP